MQGPQNKPMIWRSQEGYSVLSITYETIRRDALDCHTPRQFKRLLIQLREIVPYRQLVCGGGNFTTLTVARVIDIDHSKRFLGWYFAHGMLRKDPLFQECIRSQEAQRRSVIMSRPGACSNSELAKKLEDFQLCYEIAGATVKGNLYVYFSLAMNNEREEHTYLRQFSTLLHPLCLALLDSYRHPQLTPREKTVLMSRVHGNAPKRIASDLGISPRTVKMHLEAIKKKLYAEDLVNAVWIAAQIGAVG